MFEVLRARIDRESARAAMHPELRARLGRERARLQNGIRDTRGALAALYTECAMDWYEEENRRGALAENLRTLEYLEDQLVQIESELYE